MDGQGAKEYIEDNVAWRAISSFGGWYNLVTQDNFNQMVFRAQFLAAYESIGTYTDREEKLQISNHPLDELTSKLIKTI